MSFLATPPREDERSGASAFFWCGMGYDGYMPNQNCKEYRYINGSIVIGFPLSKTMQDLVVEAEKADMAGDYGLYMNLADAIDSQAKKETSRHVLRESEWKALVRRYRV